MIKLIVVLIGMLNGLREATSTLFALVKLFNQYVFFLFFFPFVFSNLIFSVFLSWHKWIVPEVSPFRHSCICCLCYSEFPITRQLMLLITNQYPSNRAFLWLFWKTLILLLSSFMHHLFSTLL